MKPQRHTFYAGHSDHPGKCTMKDDYSQGVCWQPKIAHMPPTIFTKINTHLSKAKEEISATMRKDRDVALALAKQNYDWSNDDDLSPAKRDEYAIQRQVWEARAEALSIALKALERHTDDEGVIK